MTHDLPATTPVASASPSDQQLVTYLTRTGVGLLTIWCPITLAVLAYEVVLYGRSIVAPALIGVIVGLGMTLRSPSPLKRSSRHQRVGGLTAIDRARLHAIIWRHCRPVWMLIPAIPLVVALGIVAVYGSVSMTAIPCLPAMVTLIAASLHLACLGWGTQFLHVRRTVMTITTVH
jgi:hypothetical protein